MSKTYSNNRINSAFEEIAEALNNPKLREGFFNDSKENKILNELVEIFDRQKIVNKPIVKSAHKLIVHVHARVNHTSSTETTKHGPARVIHTPNTKKIPYVPARVSHD